MEFSANVPFDKLTPQDQETALRSLRSSRGRRNLVVPRTNDERFDLFKDLAKGNTTYQIDLNQVSDIATRDRYILSLTPKARKNLKKKGLALSSPFTKKDTTPPEVVPFSTKEPSEYKPLEVVELSEDVPSTSVYEPPREIPHTSPSFKLLNPRIPAEVEARIQKAFSLKRKSVKVTPELIKSLIRHRRVPWSMYNPINF